MELVAVVLQLYLYAQLLLNETSGITSHTDIKIMFLGINYSSKKLLMF